MKRGYIEELTSESQTSRSFVNKVDGDSIMHPVLGYNQKVKDFVKDSTCSPVVLRVSRN